MTMSDEDHARLVALNADVLRARAESRAKTRERDAFVCELFESHRADQPDLKEALDVASRNAVYLIIKDTARARANRQDARHVEHAEASRAKRRQAQRRSR